VSRPLLLDGFCGPGGAAQGYADAGFEVIGVDNRPQKHYPHRFVLGDFFEHVERYGHLYDAFHASPPCQGYSKMRHLPWLAGREWPMLIGQVRDTLKACGKPWVIENVEGAPLDGITLCATMFGLKGYLHRRFESSVLLMQPDHAPHRQVVCAGRLYNDRRGRPEADGWFTHANKTPADVGIRHYMTVREARQAIVPAYTKYVGEQLIAFVGEEAA
jgi:DNA (cytosine-5)-methyltransferase 1